MEESNKIELTGVTIQEVGAPVRDVTPAVISRDGASVNTALTTNNTISSSDVSAEQVMMALLQEPVSSSRDFVIHTGPVGYNLMQEVIAGEITRRGETTEASEELPVLKRSAFISDERLRFSGATWFEEVSKHIVMVGGAGGIGSFLTMYLARMGAEIHVYDFDTVEQVNLAGQLFTKSCIGLSKVGAIAKMCNGFSPSHLVIGHNETITATTPVRSIVFSCFDNMIARACLFTSWHNYCKEHPEQPALFIDARLSAEAYQVYVITNEQARIEKYTKDCLFTDAEADASICSYKQTTHMAAMVSARMAAYYSSFLHNISNEDKRPLPFLDEYDNENFYFKISM